MDTLLSNLNNQVRISLPSKGRLAEDSMALLNACGLTVDKPNPRQYQASILGLPELSVLFQRPGDIVASVRDGSVEFGITGLDVTEERKGDNGDVLILHDDLNFGSCYLALAVPETWENVTNLEGLRQRTLASGKPLRVATKYPVLTSRFLASYQIPNVLISAEGTLETAPTIGYADIISDLVSSGQTLRDNRLRLLSDGLVLRSQATLIANMTALKKNPLALKIARVLLEYFEAHLRAVDNLAVFANMRGSSPEEIGKKIFNRMTVTGLQGPTISKVITREQSSNWYAVNLIVRRSELFMAVNELRSIGGSGVVVLPVNYIFEEEPPRYTAMLQAIESSK
jgi:ATP phosphoribosyltransferase